MNIGRNPVRISGINTGKTSTTNPGKGSRREFVNTLEESLGGTLVEIHGITPVETLGQIFGRTPMEIREIP